MTNHNRKDELAEHCESFSKKQIERLPETMNRQISRAKNMMFFGGKRLIELRERNPFPDLALDDDAMRILYREIQAEDFIVPRNWKSSYVRYLMEWIWLGGLLDPRMWSPAEVMVFAQRRAAAESSLEGIEKTHGIRLDDRWNPADGRYDEHRVSARNLWLDDMIGAIRTSVTKELHWRSMLHDHGHSKLTNNAFRRSLKTFQLGKKRPEG